MESENMELVLLNPQEGGFLKHIDWNMEDIKGQVQSIVEAYTDIAYTEETMAQAKEDRQRLNKLKCAIDDRRKMVKKKCLEPYNLFEAEVKEVLKLIEEPIGIIDVQVKEYESRQKEEKKSKIKSVYDDNIGKLAMIIPFEKLFDNRYLNVTYSLKKACEDISGKISKIKSDLEVIESLDSKYKLNAKDVYIRTLDLSQAMAENKRLADLEKKLEEDRIRKEADAERRRQEEIRKKQEQEENERRKAAVIEEWKAEQKAKEEARKLEEESAKKVAEEQPAPVVEEKKDVAVDAFQTQEQKEEPRKKTKTAEAKKVRARFYAVGTREQLTALTKYMKDNGIKYGKAD